MKMGARTGICHDPHVAVTYAGVAQMNEDLANTWLRGVDFLNLGRDFAWLIIYQSLVLRGDLGGSHSGCFGVVWIAFAK
jgi:hypothetical protein